MNINNNSSTINPEYVNFFVELIKLDKILCPLSENFMFDPVRLPCNHIFSERHISDWYLKNGRKICPICTTPYLIPAKDLSLQEITTSFFNKIYQPNQIFMNQIYEIYNTMAECPEKQKVKEAIDTFSKGSLDQGIMKIANIMMFSTNESFYSPILSLMNQHQDNISIILTKLHQQTHLSHVGSHQGPEIPAPEARNNQMLVEVPATSSATIRSDQNALRSDLGTVGTLNDQSSTHLPTPISANIPFPNMAMSNAESAIPTAPMSINVPVPNVDRPSAEPVVPSLPPTSMTPNDANPALILLRNGEILNSSTSSTTTTDQETNASVGNQQQKRPAQDGFYQPVAKRLRSKNGRRSNAGEEELNGDLNQDLENNNSRADGDQTEEEEVFIARIVPAAPRAKQSIKSEPRYHRDPENDQSMEESQENNHASSQEMSLSEKNLIRAIKNKHRRPIYDHLKKNLNVNVQDEEGNTPLHLVILNYAKTEGYIQALFDKKANLDIQNNEGNTALHLASIKGSVNAVKLLRKLGASTSIRNNANERPRNIATSKKVKEALKSKRSS